MMVACAFRTFSHGDGICDPTELLTVQLKSGLLISSAAFLWMAHAIPKAAKWKLSSAE